MAATGDRMATVALASARWRESSSIDCCFFSRFIVWDYQLSGCETVGGTVFTLSR